MAREPLSGTDHPALNFSQTVSASVHGAVLLLTIDNPPVNALSTDVRQGLMAMLEHVRANASVEAVVLTGAGKTFIGGADIREFGLPPVEPLLPAVVENIEACEKPIVAAINGAALGGGLEVALACHHRVAIPDAKAGLPEVKLGIVPGAGGTQRLPRLVGVVKAAALIGSGNVIPATEAHDLGLIDTVVTDGLLETAVPIAASLAGKAVRRTGMLPVPETEPAELEKASAGILAKARGQAAPAEAIRLVRLSADASLEEGLAEERRTFLRLRDSDQATALRYVFFAERETLKVEGLEGVEARPVSTIGVAGLGLMGSGITVAALKAGYRLIGLEQTDEAAAKGQERVTALLQKALDSGRMDQAAFDGQMSRLSVTARDADLAGCDLVIEAVFDDLAVKKDLFRRLENVLRADAILATNTSYLNPDEIAAVVADPSRVLAMHFFSPAHIMRLAEVVRCAKTAPDVLAAGLAVARRMGKLPVVTGVCEGFIGNRVFSAYRREAEFLLEDGALPEEVDAALEDYGFAMGLFAVYDLAGLEIAWARRKRQAATRDPAGRYADIADRLCEAGRFGQKTGAGWYAYPDGKRKVDPVVTAIIEEARRIKGIEPRRFENHEIVSRLLSSMAREGEALLAEGIAARAGDIDLVMINGYGFPAHRGGPMFAQGTRAV